MTITEIIEAVAFAEDSKTKKGELVELVKTLAVALEKSLTEVKPEPKSKPNQKAPSPIQVMAIAALEKCAKREVSVVARRALKEIKSLG